MSLRDHIAALPIVDTHSHMAGGDFGSPPDNRAGPSMPQVLMSDHLRCLLEWIGSVRPKFSTIAMTTGAFSMRSG